MQSAVYVLSYGDPVVPARAGGLLEVDDVVPRWTVTLTVELEPVPTQTCGQMTGEDLFTGEWEVPCSLHGVGLGSGSVTGDWRVPWGLQGWGQGSLGSGRYQINCRELGEDRDIGD